ncbi:hypothetical protein [Thermogemmatispora sp.]|uniref:hypothetical protein n=1 Tax=Thermogemmatispora sp. TaxID=1968838 RepID=UPI00260BA365|nr:hypothetical protein [Thermogemmatispora sp.]
MRIVVDRLRITVVPLAVVTCSSWYRGGHRGGSSLGYRGGFPGPLHHTLLTTDTGPFLSL